MNGGRIAIGSKIWAEWVFGFFSFLAPSNLQQDSTAAPVFFFSPANVTTGGKTAFASKPITIEDTSNPITPLDALILILLGLYADCEGVGEKDQPSQRFQ